ncbi:uncharacterized protein cubi_03218 [Cryptosporidium ubiquitum]|uniref:Uncharacterized protein n=1 Tax=Cryptosporidium ubiquitum TaxID=857276 RepID=A0A1J4MLR1_9CRYT|nr:uncharacterized protein cubi_03218 [Cryptosporidium ubiquitum]OII75202.1 hypothetical protein cubi_03218 [Cryptosporidium ubiquitum]
MKHSRETIRLMATTELRSYSDDELPVITPCSAPYSSFDSNRDSILNPFGNFLPSVKVYSEQDGTYVTFHIKTAETNVADLKNFINSLRDTKRTHQSSMNSQASTMDSDLNSSQQKKDGEMSLFGRNILIYGDIPGLPKRMFSDSDTILQVIRETHDLKLYYSSESFENKKYSENELMVTVYPKANLYEFGIKCLITISESGLKFVTEREEKSSNKIIFISFDDVCSIVVYKQVENCFLIKRKSIGKNPFLIRACSSFDFNIIKKRLKQVSEINRDSKLISDADSRLALSNANINNVGSLTNMNALTTFYEFLSSELGRIFFFKWIESIGQDSQKFFEMKIMKFKPENNDLNNLVTFKQIKEALLNQEYSLLAEEKGFYDLLVQFERYVKETSPPIEDILQVN